MSAVTVSLPGPLRRLAAGAAEVRCPGDTVGAVIHSLTAAHPHLGKGLFTPEGQPRRFVRLYLDDQEIGGDSLATPVADGACLTIVVALAGG
jgi:molybdopterin converting factor small subunit